MIGARGSRYGFGSLNTKDEQHAAPSDLGKLRLCWSRCLDALRCLVRLVGETALAQDEDQRREHDDGEPQEEEASCRRNHRQIVRQGNRRPIQRSVQKRDDENAARCLVEDPRLGDPDSCTQNNINLVLLLWFLVPHYSEVRSRSKMLPHCMRQNTRLRPCLSTGRHRTAASSADSATFHRKHADRS